MHTFTVYVRMCVYFIIMIVFICIAPYIKNSAQRRLLHGLYA